MTTVDKHPLNNGNKPKRQPSAVMIEHALAGLRAKDHEGEVKNDGQAQDGTACSLGKLVFFSLRLMKLPTPASEESKSRRARLSHSSPFNTGCHELQNLSLPELRQP